MSLLAKYRLPNVLVEKPMATPAEPATARALTMKEKLGLTNEGLPSGQAPLFGRGVTESRDLHRVLELPRRDRPSTEQLAVLAAGYKRKLGTGAPVCTCLTRFKKSHCCQDLLEVQAWALSEIEKMGGLLGPIGVGHGKTLLDLLTPMVVKDCKVAVLLLPPNLKAQLLEVDWHFYGQHWRLPNLAGGRYFYPGRPILHVVAYTELSSARNSDLLTRIAPDTIICDEAHSVRNRTASRTKRFLRYLEGHKEVRLFCWSGTLTARSLKDYAHLAEHALAERSPAPLVYPVVEEWAKALDPTDFRNAPGALLRFCAPGQLVADGFRERLVSSPGVVSSGDAGGCDASLIISERKVKTPTVIKNMLANLEELAERPDGELLVSALDVARSARELSCGFYYHWTWPRGEPDPVRAEWLRVRKEWHREMRERLKRSSEFMDSPLLLTKAAIRWHDGYVSIERDEAGNELARHEWPPHCRKGPYPVWDSEWWPQWKAVRGTAEPLTEPVWVDDFLVQSCVEWLREAPGLLWYEFSAFGKAVAAAMPEAVFCGPGEEGNQRVICLTGEERCVISIKAHGTGKNLQAFSRNLVANTPSDGAVSEQLLGRTHRTGQRADEVTAEYFLHTQPFRDAMVRARELSLYISKTFGAKQILADRASILF